MFHLAGRANSCRFVFRFRDGRIIEVTEHLDIELVRSALLR